MSQFVVTPRIRSPAAKDPVMSLISLRRFLFLALLTVGCAGQTVAAEPFEIKAGDRVVVIGDTWFEREGVAAELETLMHQRF
jgi:hypothetical protein